MRACYACWNKCKIGLCATHKHFAFTYRFCCILKNKYLLKTSGRVFGILSGTEVHLRVHSVVYSLTFPNFLN